VTPKKKNLAAKTHPGGRFIYHGRSFVGGLAHVLSKTR